VIVFIDVETTGLSAHADRLVLVGFDGGSGPVFGRHPVDGDLIQGFLDLDATFVGHNINFDMHFLGASGYRIPPSERWRDTQLLAHVAGVDGERKGGNTALASLTKRLIAAGELPEDILEPEVSIKGWLLGARRTAKQEGRRRPQLGDAPAHLLRSYLAADLTCTRAVARHYGAALNGQARVLELERRCAPAVFHAERRGAPIDIAAAEMVAEQSTAKLADLEARLHHAASQPFNFNSAAHIEHALLGRGVDLAGAKRTPTGKLQTTPDALQQIDDELVELLLEHRAERIFHALLDGLLRYTAPDGRCHPSFRQVGCETGRMSCGTPNLQNVPASDLRARYAVAAPPGRALVACDLNNVELRCLAAYAPGGKLAESFAGGADLHARTAERFGIERDLAKTLNFGILYGAGASRVSQILGIDSESAQEVRDQWWRLWPEIAHLKAGLGRVIRRRGYLQTAGGRRHYMDKPNHLTLNYLIQGSAADLFKAAMAELHARGVEMILFIHDEIVAEVDEGHAEKTGRVLEEVMSRDFGPIRNLKAEATIGKRWSDLKQPGYQP
jgi:DNA polymerase I-like protein with 3'-5' exonuclease and polymerase domains